MPRWGNPKTGGHGGLLVSPKPGIFFKKKGGGKDPGKRGEGGGIEPDDLPG